MVNPLYNEPSPQTPEMETVNHPQMAVVYGSGFLGLVLISHITMHTTTHIFSSESSRGLVNATTEAMLKAAVGAYILPTKISSLALRSTIQYHQSPHISGLWTPHLWMEKNILFPTKSGPNLVQPPAWTADGFQKVQLAISLDLLLADL